MKKFLFAIFLLAFSFFTYAGAKHFTAGAKPFTAGTKPFISKKVFVISIGINDYQHPLSTLQYCVSDSRAIVEKIIKDNPRRSDKEARELNLSRRKINISTKIDKVFAVDSVYSYILNDNQATLHNIREVFKEVIKKATPTDYFIFNFGGISLELSEMETALITYQNDPIDINDINPEQVLMLNELAQWMEQIQSEKQLIISEAGNGSQFAQNLITELFESNPLMAANSDRDRIIITTRSFGYEFGVCEDGRKTDGGPLIYFLLQSGNILNAFENLDEYEFNLQKTEIKCNVLDGRKYTAIYREEDFRKTLVNNYNKSLSRGTQTYSTVSETKEPSKESKVYGLFVATNEYLKTPGWPRLQNPVNDAESISEVLATKYNVQVHKVYNKPQDSVLMEILKIKKLMDDNDRFIFFIAGHGYYSENFSDGYLVFENSRSVNEDPTLQSYLQMASLNRILDNMPSKNVFAIFDVCFGASFDLNSRDLALSAYDDMLKDMSIEEFIERKSDSRSRIFLASGRYEVPDYWINSEKHSPFANKLINVLASEPAFISPGIIFSKLEGNVTAPFLKQFGSHETRGDFLLRVSR